MRDLATISICSDAFTNLDDCNFHFDIDCMMFNNPRKLGRGSRRLGSRGSEAAGDYGAGDAAKLQCHWLHQM